MRATNRIRLDQFLLAGLLIFLPVSTIAWWIAGSYLQIDIFKSISFLSADGWCQPDRQGLGVHCFGDFHYAALMALSEDPWDGSIGTNPYPGAGLLPVFLPEALGQALELPGLGVLLYLMLLVISLSLPAIWATRKQPAVTRAAFFAVSGPASLVAVQALDRGNSVALLTPLLLWFLVALQRRHQGQVICAIISCSLIKPHFALLIFIPLAWRWWRVSIATASGVFLLNIASFLLWPNAFPGSIGRALEMARNFQAYAPLSDFWPPQISFSQGTYFLEYSLRIILDRNPSSMNYFAEQTRDSLGLGIVLVVLCWILLMGRQLNTLVSATILISVIGMASGTTYGYYGVIYLAVAAAIFRFSAENKGHLPGVSNCVGLILASATGLSIVRLPLPPLGSSPLDIVPATALLTPLFWILALALVMIITTTSRVRALRQPHPLRDLD